jgi:hypothetical protein
MELRMRRIQAVAEPADFDVEVRQYGKRFLKRNAKPTSRDFSAHAYWRKALRQLHDSYRGICAYSCHFIPFDTGADTVEHFLPKSLYPANAYEWANYRLVCQTLNGRKGDNEDVLDPFRVDDGWFVVDFPSLLVKAHRELDAKLRARVLDTCDRLGLNDEATCLAARERFVRAFCTGNVSWEYLRRDAPFIASELERQGLRDGIREMMNYNAATDPDWS